MYHGLPDDLHFVGAERGGYLAFIGRIAEEKRPDRAIEIATRAGMKLKLAAKIDEVDREYFPQNIEPLFDNPQVGFARITVCDECERDEGGGAILMSSSPE